MESALYETFCLVDGDIHGRYTGQMLSYRLYGWSIDGKSLDDDHELIQILRSGPDHDLYDEALDEIIQKAVRIDPNGQEWHLWLDGSVFAYTGDGEQWV